MLIRNESTEGMKFSWLIGFYRIANAVSLI